MTEIVPAILSSDESDFRKKHAELLSISEHFKRIHIDFIDGEFLPNQTLLPKQLKFLYSPFKLLAHLMVYDPTQYFQELKALNFEWIIVQFESFPNEAEALAAVAAGQALGLRMGLALNPETELAAALNVITKVGLVQIMGVHPGAQGRVFEDKTLDKIRELKSLAPNVIIIVDGGIKLGIATKCERAGADFLVVGSAIVKSAHPKEVVEAFIRELKKI